MIAVAFALDQPEDTNVSEFTIGPTTQPWQGASARSRCGHGKWTQEVEP